MRAPPDSSERERMTSEAESSHRRARGSPAFEQAVVVWTTRLEGRGLPRQSTRSVFAHMACLATSCDGNRGLDMACLVTS